MTSIDVLSVEVFEVTKVHHERSWLRQSRLLIISADAVMKAPIPENCTLAQIRADLKLVEPSKTHPISSLQNVLLFSKTKFSLQFKGDHPYFYKCPDAIQIARILHERQGLLHTAAILTPQRPSLALRKLGASLVNTELDATRLCPQKLDFIQTFRAGGVDHSDKVNDLTERMKSLSANVKDADRFDVDASSAFLASFRNELTDIREQFVEQVVSRERSLRSKFMAKIERRKLPKFENPDDARLCLEEAVQNLVLTADVFRLLWLHSVAVAAKEQDTFDSNCTAMNLLPLSFFGVHNDFHNVKFDLVVEYLLSLEHCHSPVGMMNTILAALKAVLICVSASQLTEVEGDDSSWDVERDVSYSADDVLPVFIYILVRAKTKHLCTVRTLVMEIGDVTEATERSYYFTVFSSALQFVLDWKPEATTSSGMRSSSVISHSPFATPRLLREMSPQSLPSGDTVAS